MILRRCIPALATVWLCGAGGIAAATAADPATPPGLAAFGGDVTRFCAINHQARGAEIGAALGRARNGEMGAAVGAAIGAERGARADAWCRSVARHGTAPMATTAPAVVPQGSAGPHHRAEPPAGRLAAVPPVGEAGEPAKPPRMPPSPRPAADAGRHLRCAASSEVTFGPQAPAAAPITGRVCEGADGQLHDM